MLIVLLNGGLFVNITVDGAESDCSVCKVCFSSESAAGLCLHPTVK